MLVYILAIPVSNEPAIFVDNAETPAQLDFSKVDGELRFEIRSHFSSEPGKTNPLVAVDLTGNESNRNWVIGQLLCELDARKGLPDYENEIKNADGPFIGFGESDFDDDGFMV